MITAFCSICCKDEVAALLREQELYWRVEGVASEQEMVARLTTINPPAPPITLTNDDDDRTNFSVAALLVEQVYVCIIIPHVHIAYELKCIGIL